jgi:pantoate--beta-alanine ligase
MEIVAQPERVTQRVREWRRQGLKVALVPTMGNLHAGHTTLVEHAHEYADRVVVSIFVNPLQFGPNEDFQAYPRTPKEDQALLEQFKTDLLFAPEVSDLYPRGMQGHTKVEVPELSDLLCGAVRPGHFVGVATVVAKLFNVVQPDVALFGEKDFQQLAVIKCMVADLCMPIKVIGIPTVRDANGLAMISRNRYLDATQRTLAPNIYRVLSEIKGHLEQGRRDYAALEQAATQQLNQLGFNTDYVAVRDSDTLYAPRENPKELVILVAARLGKARLIDNLVVKLG